MSFFNARNRYVDELLAAQQRELEELRKEPEEQQENPNYKQRAEMMQEELSFRDKLSLMGGAVAAGLLVAGVFIVAAFLFLLFCTKVWLA